MTDVSKGVWLGKNQKEVADKIQNLNSDGNLTGDVTGDLTGDVTGNLTGDVVGNINGKISSTPYVYTDSGIISPNNGDIAVIDPSSGSVTMTIAGTILDGSRLKILAKAGTYDIVIDSTSFPSGLNSITFSGNSTGWAELYYIDSDRDWYLFGTNGVVA